MTAAAAAAISAAPSAVASSNTASTIVDICAQLAPIASIALCFSPFPTIKNIRNSKSVGNLPLLPYTTLLANAFLWTTYGVLKKDNLIIRPNAVGFVMGLFYFVTFLRYSPKSSPTLPGSVTTHTQSVLALMMITLFVASRTISSIKNPTEWIGKAGVAMCICLFASPLSVLKDVIKEKSAQAIPLPFTIASLLNCFFWTVTGVYKMKDVNIYLPNFLGLVCAVAQVVLKVIYSGGGQKKVDIPINKCRTLVDDIVLYSTQTVQYRAENVCK